VRTGLGPFRLLGASIHTLVTKPRVYWVLGVPYYIFVPRCASKAKPGPRSYPVPHGTETGTLIKPSSRRQATSSSPDQPPVNEGRPNSMSSLLALICFPPPPSTCSRHRLGCPPLLREQQRFLVHAYDVCLCDATPLSTILRAFFVHLRACFMSSSLVLMPVKPSESLCLLGSSVCVLWRDVSRLNAVSSVVGFLVAPFFLPC
jgi:hypothetical protein